MPDRRASITDALAAQRSFCSGGSAREVEFRLQSLQRRREVFLRDEEIELLLQVLRLPN